MKKLFALALAWVLPVLCALAANPTFQSFNTADFTANQNANTVKFGFGKPVSEYGTLGTADDTAVFQTALNAGGHLYIPAGTYTLAGSLVVPAGTWLEGWGNARLLANASQAGVFITATNANTILDNFTVDGFDNSAGGPAGAYNNDGGRIGFLLGTSPGNNTLYHNLTAVRFNGNGFRFYGTNSDGGTPAFVSPVPNIYDLFGQSNYIDFNCTSQDSTHMLDYQHFVHFVSRVSTYALKPDAKNITFSLCDFSNDRTAVWNSNTFGGGAIAYTISDSTINHNIDFACGLFNVNGYADYDNVRMDAAALVRLTNCFGVTFRNCHFASGGGFESESGGNNSFVNNDYVGTWPGSIPVYSFGESPVSWYVHGNHSSTVTGDFDNNIAFTPPSATPPKPTSVLVAAATSASPFAATTGQWTNALALNKLTTTNGVNSLANYQLGPAVLTPGGSPWTFGSGLGTNGYLILSGGIISVISINGTVVGTGLTVTGCTTIPLQGGETATITYSSAPAAFFKPF